MVSLRVLEGGEPVALAAIVMFLAGTVVVVVWLVAMLWRLGDRKERETIEYIEPRVDPVDAYVKSVRKRNVQEKLRAVKGGRE